MAILKILNTTKLDNNLSDIGNAIRNLNDSSDTYKIEDMAEAIENIPQEGAWIKINDVAARRIGENITINTNIGAYAFYNSDVESVVMNCATIGANAFDACASLKNAEFNYTGTGTPTIANNLFLNCSNLESFKHPYTANIGSNTFQNCSQLGPFFVINCGGVWTSAFQNCAKLQAIDFGPRLAGSGLSRPSMFYGCSILKTLILRGTTNIWEISNTNAFTNTPFASGKSGSTLYVPQALITTYQEATNWSTILAYENNQILPIEGSIYETQYADGTPIE